MVELPEIHLYVQQINQHLVGKKIKKAIVNQSPHSFAWYGEHPSEAFKGSCLNYAECLIGQTIQRAQPYAGRCCGYTAAVYTENRVLLLSAMLLYVACGQQPPKSHQMLLLFEDGSSLACIVQQYGCLYCWKLDEEGKPLGWQEDENPALTPLEEGFDRNYFEQLLQSVGRKGMTVASFLTSKERIPGLGSEVMQDILWQARINPMSKIEFLDRTQRNRLFFAVKDVLGDMIQAGGRNTQTDLFGVAGGYCTVESNESQRCPICGQPMVKNSSLEGNLCYCPVCQPVA